MLKQDKLSAGTAVFILLSGISSIALLVPRDYTSLLGLAYLSSFIGYFWLCRFELSFPAVMSIGVVARLVLFAGMPSLSDDIYRFLWDGHLLQAGISPYAHLPGHYVEGSTRIPGITKELYARLNSPGYFTIYPPLNQWIFRISVSLSSSWLQSTNIIRSLLLLADIGSLIVLRKILTTENADQSTAKWFFLNPLLILELTGNVHFEGLVIFFLLVGLYFFLKSKNFFSGLSFGMAIATKLLPLIYLPAILFYRSTRKGFAVTAAAVIIACFSFLPMLDSSLINGLQSSLALYFTRFEFNASVYFLVREVGFWIVGYNVIYLLGPFLAFVTLMLILALCWYSQKHEWPLEKTMLFILTIYLLLATTVHPWYILPLIPLGLLCGFYFPIIWSLVIFVTYFGYSQNGYELSAWWIVLEYVIVIITMISELKKEAHA